VIPMDRWSRITEKGMQFALCISTEIQVVHVACEEDPDMHAKEWEKKVGEPLRAANLPVPKLVVLHSPYRFVVAPVVQHVLGLEAKHENRIIAVLVPELVVRHWYQTLLHNQRAQLLKVALLLKGNRRTLVINIPWYLDKPK